MMVGFLLAGPFPARVAAPHLRRKPPLVAGHHAGGTSGGKTWDEVPQSRSISKVTNLFQLLKENREIKKW
ncbi:hypothetical protein ACCD06_13845 [Azospirillum sp. CT11-132]|uniref:hypothetical protein n=1 Tax=Azospirillum sp. CT11-132 TaxID=3396317 RepID=UPI0039A4C1AB